MEKIQELRSAKFSDGKIARITGLSQPTITRIGNGDQKGANELTYFAVSKLHYEYFANNSAA